MRVNVVPFTYIDRLTGLRQVRGLVFFLTGDTSPVIPAPVREKVNPKRGEPVRGI